MTQEEILFNKRCAKFLGYEFKYYTDDRTKVTSEVHFEWGGAARLLKSCNVDGGDNNWWRCSKSPNDGFSWHFPTDLKFHYDWNKIIEVAETIKNIIGNPSTITMAGFNADLNKALMSIDKVRVVEAINQFLIWYEQNK